MKPKISIAVSALGLLILFTISLSSCSIFQKKYTKTETKEYNFNPAGKKKIILSNSGGPVIVKKSNDSLVNIKIERTYKVRKNEVDKIITDNLVKIDSSSDYIKINIENNVKEIHIFQFNFNFSERNLCQLFIPGDIEVILENTNSKVEIIDVNNDLTADVTNGSLTINNAPGKLKLDVTNGSVTCKVDSTKGINANVTNGKFSLYAGDNLCGKFDLSSTNGKVKNEWKENLFSSKNKNEMIGTIGNSDAEIKISTLNGGIRLYKK
jgi:hypothetical protein